MTDYNKIRRFCEQESRLTAEVLDNFLLYYAGEKEKLPKEFISLLMRFRHAIGGMPSGWIPSITSQFIAHRLFKSGGLIKKYLNHVTVKNLDPKQYTFLQLLSDTPWRFSFSEIRSQPAPDFYEMEDVFTGERFLLFSKGIGQILAEHKVLLWFNLVGFNGHCWQTYGPIGNFQSFDADDVFFYATELDRSITSEATLFNYLEKNPVPFMMLMTGASYPLIMNNGYEVVQVCGESPLKTINISELQKKFTVEHAHGVTRISHLQWSDPPHLAEAYYEEKSETISLTALTDSGYKNMAGLLKEFAPDLPAEPDVRVHLPMITFIKDVLKKDITLTPHAHLFEKTPEPADAEMMDNLNVALQMALPYVNSGVAPDLDAIAKKTGLPVDTVADLLQHVMGKVEKLKKKGRK
ncbi:MAG: hypothetical protein EOO04_01080 [Chitinophagaceae bacterium]|nr:MAG: hypothetical protein EOO04_01080 [Chitinophagaceae bacterium]